MKMQNYVRINRPQKKKSTAKVFFLIPKALSPLNKLDSCRAPLPTRILIMNFFICTESEAVRAN